MEEAGLLALPQEVLIHLSRFLSLKDLLACSATCSYLRSVLNENCIWKTHYRKAVVDYIKTAKSFVSPKFEYNKESETLEQLCEERINLLRQNHMLNNWRQGKFVNHEAYTPGNGLFPETNDWQIIYDNIYLFLYVLNTNEINIWNIGEVPFLHTSVQFTLYEYNMEDEDWTDIVRVFYEVVKNKLIVIQGNLVQIFNINLPDKDLPIEYLISVGRDEAVPYFSETLNTDCCSWIVGHLLFSRLGSLPVVHIWDIVTGTKIKALRAPITGWDLYVISLEDMDNVIFTLRTDERLADQLGDREGGYTTISNHISSYNVSKDEYTTLFQNLTGCIPLHAMQYRNFIVLFCMFGLKHSIYVLDCQTFVETARRTSSDLVGLYKSRIIEDRLILATRNSVEILDVQTLEILKSLKINDIIDIDYLPVFDTTFIISSSMKSDIVIWDIAKNQLLPKMSLKRLVFLNESCSKLIMISGQKLIIKNFW